VNVLQNIKTLVHVKGKADIRAWYSRHLFDLFAREFVDVFAPFVASWTPLFCAVFYNHSFEFVKTLLDAGADINA
jgi:hypothetical protein